MATMPMPARLPGRFAASQATNVMLKTQKKKELAARQEGLGKPGNDFAAMILIRKNPEWWKLSQNERRGIFEAQSKHIAIGMRYLPQIARRLHHSRDLGENEPFDFITWFEFSANNENLFDELLSDLRSTQEWNFVSREIDVRVSRSIQTLLA